MSLSFLPCAWEKLLICTLEAACIVCLVICNSKRFSLLSIAFQRRNIKLNISMDFIVRTLLYLVSLTVLRKYMQDMVAETLPPCGYGNYCYPSCRAISLRCLAHMETEAANRKCLQARGCYHSRARTPAAMMELIWVYLYRFIFSESLSLYLTLAASHIFHSARNFCSVTVHFSIVMR